MKAWPSTPGVEVTIQHSTLLDIVDLDLCIAESFNALSC